MIKNYLSKYRSLKNECYVKDKNEIVTHTSLSGGRYNFSGPNYDIFNKLYKKVYQKMNESMVERPGITTYMFIDVDWHSNSGTREYRLKHIEKIIVEANNIIYKYFNIQKGWLNAYAHEKETITSETKGGKTTYKDGFHILYPDLPLFATHRYFILNKLSEVIKEKAIFRDIQYVGDWSKIFDKSVVLGNGVLMFGSAKKGRKPYQVTHIYNHAMEKLDMEEYDNEYLFDMLLNRRFLEDDHIELRSTLTQKHLYEVKKRYNALITPGDKKRLANSERYLSDLKRHKGDDDNDSDNDEYDYDRATKSQNNNQNHNQNHNQNQNENHNQNTSMYDDSDNENDIDDKLNRQFNTDYEPCKKDAQIAKRLMRLFSRKRATGYDSWMNVGFAAHNISGKLYESFVKFSKKTKRNNFTESACKKLWDESHGNRYTIAAFYRWAREDATPEAYKKAMKDIADPLIKKAITGTHYDVANMIFTIYRDRYKCVNIKNDIWFEFQGHKWVEVQSAYTLLENISGQISEEFFRYHSILAKENHENAGVSRDDNMVRIKKMLKIHDDLKSGPYVKYIKEYCARKFYDPLFEEKLNDDPQLIGFENGIIDLSTEKPSFRRGNPDDYVTFSVGYKYNSAYTGKEQIFTEIKDYFDKIQLKPEMREYYMLFLASCLLGIPDQHFHVWTGSGANGKSTTIELLKKLMGDYFGILPVVLFTRRRKDSGPTPELFDKHGKRVLITQEPESNDTIYVGFLKEITGSDTISCRGMYEKKMFEYIPQFKIIMPCNELPAISGNDDGTWRRIRTIPHNSKFVKGEPTKDNEFKMDRSIPEKFGKWAPALMWLLINEYFPKLKKNGYTIHEPDDVLEATKKYKADSDIYFEFMCEHIKETGKEEDKEHFDVVYAMFKSWYSESYGKSAPPKKAFRHYIVNYRKDLKIDKHFIYGVVMDTD